MYIHVWTNVALFVVSLPEMMMVIIIIICRVLLSLIDRVFAIYTNVTRIWKILMYPNPKYILLTVKGDELSTERLVLISVK